MATITMMNATPAALAAFAGAGVAATQSAALSTAPLATAEGDAFAMAPEAKPRSGKPFAGIWCPPPAVVAAYSAAHSGRTGSAWRSGGGAGGAGAAGGSDDNGKKACNSFAERLAACIAAGDRKGQLELLEEIVDSLYPQDPDAPATSMEDQIHRRDLVSIVARVLDKNEIAEFKLARSHFKDHSTGDPLLSIVVRALKIARFNAVAGPISMARRGRAGGASSSGGTSGAGSAGAAGGSDDDGKKAGPRFFGIAEADAPSPLHREEIVSLVAAALAEGDVAMLSRAVSEAGRRSTQDDLLALFADAVKRARFDAIDGPILIQQLLNEIAATCSNGYLTDISPRHLRTLNSYLRQGPDAVRAAMREWVQAWGTAEKQEDTERSEVRKGFVLGPLVALARSSAQVSEEMEAEMANAFYDACLALPKPYPRLVAEMITIADGWQVALEKRAKAERASGDAARHEFAAGTLKMVAAHRRHFS